MRKLLVVMLACGITGCIGEEPTALDETEGTAEEELATEEEIASDELATNEAASAQAAAEEATATEEGTATEEDAIAKLEAMAGRAAGSTVERTEDELPSPSAAACGRPGPNRENRRVNNASSPNAARQRSGSSTGCVALGVLQPTDDAVYYCYTVVHTADRTKTWTYLRSLRTGVRGWVLDDLLRLNAGGITRGSLSPCGF
jgi:hypothetical protein